MAQTHPNLTDLFTPGGRLVSGSLTEKQTKDYENQPIPVEDQEFFFAVAVNKSQPGIMELLNRLHAYASSCYANNPMVMQQINMGLAAPGFSWKVEDGDVAKMDRQTGQPREIPDYIQGCYIIKFRTKYPFGACDNNAVEINPADIKRGDYIDVKFDAAPNGRVDGNAGILLYPKAVRRLGFGPAIAGGSVDAAKAFEGHAAALPPGATVQPTASGMTPMVAPMGMGAGPQAAAMGMTPMGNGMGMGGIPAAPGGNPASMPMQQYAQPAQGGMGMPAATPGNSTAYPSDPTQAGIQPHNGILQGPMGGGMPRG